MKCLYCGSELTQAARFCGSCGRACPNEESAPVLATPAIGIAPQKPPVAPGATAIHTENKGPAGNPTQQEAESPFASAPAVNPQATILNGSFESAVRGRGVYPPKQAGHTHRPPAAQNMQNGGLATAEYLVLLIIGLVPLAGQLFFITLAFSNVVPRAKTFAKAMLLFYACSFFAIYLFFAGIFGRLF